MKFVEEFDEKEEFMRVLFGVVVIDSGSGSGSGSGCCGGELLLVCCFWDLFFFDFI